MELRSTGVEIFGLMGRQPFKAHPRTGRTQNETPNRVSSINSGDRNPGTVYPCYKV